MASASILRKRRNASDIATYGSRNTIELNANRLQNSVDVAVGQAEQHTVDQG